MNGRAHVALGAASALGTLYVGASPFEGICLIGISAGFALGPDIDHPGSTISRAMPEFIHQRFRALGMFLRIASETGKDRTVRRHWERRGIDPDHRSVTHTVLSVVIVAVVVMILSQVAIGVIALSVLAAWWCRSPCRLIWPVLVIPVTSCLVVRPDPLHMTMAAALGWLTHVVADACTKGGVPLLWPARIRGRRFYRIRLLGRMLPSGHGAEWAVAAALAVMFNFYVLFN